MSTGRRVLTLLDHASDQGGAERFALALAMRLPARGFESVVCSTRWTNPSVEPQLQAAGVRHVNLGRRTKWDLHRFRGLIAMLHRGHFDLLHAHMFGSNFWGSMLGGAARVPVILAHEHNWSYSGGRLRMLIDREVIGRLATRFIAVSEANRRRMIELEGVAPDRVVVLPTAYIPHASTSEQGIRAELGIAAEAPIVAVAATLRPEKALHVLIDAVAQVRQAFPDLRVVIAGDGPCRHALENRARQRGLDGTVHFLGARRDVSSILVEADIGAMSSEWEGMPLFVFECMATNTAIIATAVGGIPEVVQDGRTGVLVPPGDPAALAGGLRDLLTDPARRRRLTAAAAEAVQPFMIETVTDRFVHLYEELLAAAGR